MSSNLTSSSLTKEEIFTIIDTLPEKFQECKNNIRGSLFKNTIAPKNIIHWKELIESEKQPQRQFNEWLSWGCTPEGPNFWMKIHDKSYSVGLNKKEIDLCFLHIELMILLLENHMPKERFSVLNKETPYFHNYYGGFKGEPDEPKESWASSAVCHKDFEHSPRNDYMWTAACYMRTPETYKIQSQYFEYIISKTGLWKDLIENVGDSFTFYRNEKGLVLGVLYKVRPEDDRRQIMLFFKAFRSLIEKASYQYFDFAKKRLSKEDDLRKAFILSQFLSSNTNDKLYARYTGDHSCFKGIISESMLEGKMKKGDARFRMDKTSSYMHSYLQGASFESIANSSDAYFAKNRFPSVLKSLLGAQIPELGYYFVINTPGGANLEEVFEKQDQLIKALM